MKYSLLNKISAVIFCFVFFNWFQPCSGFCAKPMQAGTSSSVDQSTARDHDKTSIDMLLSISALEKTLIRRIAEKKRLVLKTGSETQKKELIMELKQLDEQLNGARSDFERIATGIDTSLFFGKKDDKFDWKKEALSLLEPGIREIKRMTVNARKKTKLRDDLEYYENLSAISHNATRNITSLITKTSNPELKRDLKALIPEWKSIEDQIHSKLQITRMQLEAMKNKEKSLIESSRISIKKFFRTRGLYLFIALVSCIFIVFFLRFLFNLLKKMIPGYNAEYMPFHIRVFELFSRIFTLIMAVFVLILVFYVFEDWVLLSLSIVFLMGLGWAAKHTLPRFWHQSRLMLNIGAVREGERIVYQGIPWMVKSINIFTILENPYINLSIRVPIEDLFGKTSRAFHQDEPWFPCRKDQWVVLSDGTWGHVTSISPETVELMMTGGAKKTYQTADFLGLSPLNLSVNFRLKIPFGIGYDHQKEATGIILEKMHSFVRKKMNEQGYAKGLLNLRVEFNEAGASSLDLVIIADFKGEMAPLYRRISRFIQKTCVDACTEYNWDIPFPQLSVHTKRENCVSGSS